MIRKSLLIVGLTLAILVTGCSDGAEKQKVADYLTQLDAFDQRMNSHTKEFESAIRGYQREVESGNEELDDIRADIASVLDEMSTEKDTFMAIEVPKKAETLNQLMKEQIEFGLYALNATLEVVDLNVEAFALAASAEQDPTKAEQVFTEIEALNERANEIQDQMRTSLEESKASHKQITEEKKMLREFSQT